MTDRVMQQTTRGLSAALWVIAVVLMLAAAAYQRLTGPTHRLRGEYTVAGETYRYRLIRSAYSTGDTLVSIPAPRLEVTGSLHYRRYPTSDEYTVLPLEVHGEQLGARIPAQPPAGKLEYYLTLETPTGTLTIPDNESGSVIMRFKGPTPLYVLLPHVGAMFFAVLIGIRAGLSALFAPRQIDKLSWATLILVTVGGLLLGPMVQKSAFGEYWTGFPFGFDLTDNKTLIMWLVWVVACVVLMRYRVRHHMRRAVVLTAAVVMIVVYLIPHSLRGSQLEYTELEVGAPAAEAIDTG